MKDYTSIEKWDDDYNGAAIYSLVDERGKRYIGQASRLQNRLETHRRELNRAHKSRDTIVSEGAKLADAARNGARFRIEILEKIDWSKSSVNNLRYWERYYLNKFGGLENTYNSGEIPDPVWTYEAFNDVALILEIDDADILGFLDRLENIQGYIKGLIRQDMKKRG